MVRGFLLRFALVLGASPLAACVNVVSAEADGGVTIQGITGGSVTDAGSMISAQAVPCVEFGYSPLTPGNTWTALYADYFGAPQPLDDGGFAGGRASCSGTVGGCHGDSTSPGANASGYVCPGDDGGACYQSLTAMSGLILPGQTFDQDLLHSYLHSDDPSSGPSNNMPKGPPSTDSNPPEQIYPCAYTFSEVDLGRLSAWVDAGFPNP